MPMKWIAVCALLLAGAATQAASLPDFAELAEENSASVVNISTSRQVEALPRRWRQLEDWFPDFLPGPEMRRIPRSSLGSGVIVSKDGYILTNHHVIEGADEILVRFSDRRELEATVVGTDPRSDLALLKVEAENLPAAALGQSENLQVGEWVMAIGSPFGFEYSVTAGIVSAKGRSLPNARRDNYVPFIQTDVAINPGNSGGPLFNLDGEVVGINSQIYSNSGGFMGVSFAIPIDVAMEVVEQLKSDGRVSRGWLGVVIQEVDRDLAESFGLDRPRGALVSQVVPDSPAEEGGLLAGDIIVEFNGRPVERSGELPHFVGRVGAGTEAELGIVRDGEQLRLEIETGELPDDEDSMLRSGRGPAQGAEPSALGLVVQDIPEALQERLDIQGGVQVLQAEGPAREAGMRPGDIISKLNNRPVEDLDGFREIAADLPKGRSVPVLVIRGNAPIFLALRVPE